MNLRQDREAAGHKDPAGAQQDSVVDPLNELPGHQHHQHQQYGAAHNRKPGHRGGIAKRPFAENRQKDDDQKHQSAGQEIVNGGEREVDVPEYSQTEKRKAEAPGPKCNCSNRENAGRQLDHQLGRVEPGAAYSPQEAELQSSDCDHQQKDTDPIERPIRREVLLVMQLPHGSNDQQTERKIDGEDRPPRGEVRQYAAQRRAKNRARHQYGAPNRENAPVPVLGIKVQQQCLDERQDNATGGTLEHPERYDFEPGSSETAEHRCRDEGKHGAAEELPRPVTSPQPARKGSRDGSGAQVTRYDPCAELQIASEVALQLW